MQSLHRGSVGRRPHARKGRSACPELRQLLVDHAVSNLRYREAVWLYAWGTGGPWEGLVIISEK